MEMASNNAHELPPIYQLALTRKGVLSLFMGAQDAL